MLRSSIVEQVRALAPLERRRFVQFMSLALAAPLVPAAARFAARELAFGEAHAQQMAEPTLFLEVNLRDQMDLMHVMVPPSLARYPNPIVGVNGEELTLFVQSGELKEYPNGVFLTNDSLELAPHVDSVAMLDTGEATIGHVHGHEAGNGMRSPGRVLDGDTSGLAPMYLIDAPTSGANGAGSEKLYASAPTPATFHNYHQRLLSADLLNGFAFKGISHFKYSVYHFGAGLPGAELTRIRSKTELFEQYGAGLSPPNALAQEILALADVPYRKDAGAGCDTLGERYRALEVGGPNPLELTVAEVVRWSEGVPNQKCTIADSWVVDCRTGPDVDPSSDGAVKAQIWEQFAYASKLFRAGRVRSIALEFDHMDLMGDGLRTEPVLRTCAQQVARPLARLISDLKAAGLYDRTVIAIYTLDGSRRPAANSYGNDGKGTLLLAGGRIKGGYYGDIAITGNLSGASGHTYAFQRPDPATGELQEPISDWGDRTKRTPSGSAWRTVVKAMGIPESQYVGKFHTLIDDAVPLDCMLRS
ncbi:MAG TPA: DUF1501 domain-containing protein [Polyangiaceae bacterium]|nr:DUF1501 domain-containing protein [Polyangiaceae bacterium]